MGNVRARRTYDHRLIELVRETGDPTIAARLGVPRSTAAGWVRRAPSAVITAPTLDATIARLQVRVARLETHARRLMALLRILIALLRIVKPDLAYLRVPQAPDKVRLLRAIDRSRDVLGLRRVPERPSAPPPG